MHKGGDGAVFKSGQAVDTGWPDAQTFQSTVGLKPGDVEEPRRLTIRRCIKAAVIVAFV